MAAYLIADISVHNAKKFNEYLSRMPEFVNKYGGKYLVKGKTPTVIEGNWSPETLVLIEFPSSESLNQFLEDTEVQALFIIRHQSTNSRLIIVNGGE